MSDMFYQKLLKNALDTIASLLLLMPAAVCILILSALIIAYDYGNPIYRQIRVGKDGREFYIYKLRSMTKGADALEETLSRELLEEYRNEYKLENDPRMIGWAKAKNKRLCLGAVLRRTSLDELPQIVINVLIFHDMSFVGPRPLIWEELERYYTCDEQKVFLSVKPGITGYWQAYGRNTVGYANHERQNMELRYARESGLWFDAQIVLKTIRVLIQENVMRVVQHLFSQNT